MTFNQQFYDASIRHQIDLLRYGSGVSQKVNRILDETRADLRKQVERRLGKSTSLDGPGLRRLRELEKAISQQRSGAWNDVSEMWERTSLDLALEESLWIEGTLTSILPVELDLVAPSDATLRALAKTRPFQGKNLKEWADSVSRADLGRIHQQIRIGMVQGESSRDIANRVFGARGAMSITANQADAVTRTVVAGVANAAQQEFLKDNSDLFDTEQLVATLDARTTPICRAQDGKQYPVGEGPIPPLHVRCRSIRVAVIDGEVVGERPFKAGTEQQMLDEYTAQRGLAPVSSRDALPKGTKKGFDEFSRRRMRELTGQVPAHTTYQQWLGGQSAKFQDDVLGPARGKLFREGGLTLDKFVNRAGDELTLEELRERNREAFESAGLDKASEKPRRTALDRERERAEKAEREAAALAQRLAEEQERARVAEAAAAAAERERKDAEARAKATERSEQARRVSALGRIAKHSDGPITLTGATDSRNMEVAAETIERVRMPKTPQLKSLEIKTDGWIDVPAFGKTIQAEGYYAPDGTLKLSTRIGVPGAPLKDTNFSMGDVAKTSDDAFARLVAHEYGHHVHISMGDYKNVDRTISDYYRKAVPQGFKRYLDDMPTPDGASPEGSPSRYGTANYKEFWAESFTAYHFDRDWLRTNKPIAFSMVEDVLERLK